MRVVRVDHEIEGFFFGFAHFEKRHASLIVNVGISAIAKILPVEMVVPLHRRRRGRVTHFTKNARKVSSVLKRGHDIGHTLIGLHEPHGPATVAVEPGADHGAAGSADGHIDLGAVEAHPLLRETIEIRRKAFGSSRTSVRMLPSVTTLPCQWGA